MGEINNTGTALRIGKGEIRDNLQQAINFVRKFPKSELRTKTVAEIKEAMRLLNNL